MCAPSRRATSIAAVKKIIAVVNRSKRVSRRDFELMVAACNVQIARDVAPLWGYMPWSVRAYKSESRLPKRCLPIRIVDDPEDVDDEGAFGWHFEEDEGQPFGRVFVNAILAECKVKSELPKWIRRHPRGVSVILSHEVVEAFIDPDINRWLKNSLLSRTCRGVTSDLMTNCCAMLTGISRACSEIPATLTRRVAKSSRVVARSSSRRIRRSGRYVTEDTEPGVSGMLVRWMPSWATWKLW